MMRSATSAPSDAAIDDAQQIALLKTDVRGRNIELDALRNALERTTRERNTYQEQLQRVYSLRWTKLGTKVRRVIVIARLSPKIALIARENPKQAVRAVGRNLRHPKRLRTLPRRLVDMTRPPAELAIERVKHLRADKQFEAALEVIESAIQQAPRNAALLDEKGTILLSLGRLTPALENARDALTIAPSPRRRAVEAAIVGRLRDLDPSWMPTLGPVHPIGWTASPGRVLHILKESRPYFERGYTMRSHYVLQSQRAAGFEPGVVTSLGFPRLDGFEHFENVEHIDDIPHFRLDLGKDYPYRTTPLDQFVAQYARQAANTVEAFRPAVLHANSGYRGYETAVVALALGRHYSIPVVYDVRSFLEATWTGDIARSQQGEHFERRLRRELSCMQKADLVFTIAETMRDDIAGRGVDPDKIVIIPNAVDPEEFTPQAPDPDLRRELGLEGKVVLGYISNIGRREGLDILVDAMTELTRTRSDVAALIVGDGPERKALIDQVRALGLSDVVTITGQVPHADIQRYYALIDVFVIPRRNDHAARSVTPLKPFEAMAMERPLLVADLPALVEVANPGVRGMTFTAEDPKSLAAQANILIEQPELRARFGAAGRSWVSAERTWASNGRRYLDAYARLGERPAASVT